VTRIRSGLPAESFPQVTPSPVVQQCALQGVVTSSFSGVCPMTLRPCIEPGCATLTSRTRCIYHQRQWQQAKDAKRPTRRSHAEQQRRRQQVIDQPWCTVCGITTDLTAGHLEDVATTGREDGPLTTLCRRHNSSSGATVRRTPS